MKPYSVFLVEVRACFPPSSRRLVIQEPKSRKGRKTQQCPSGPGASRRLRPPRGEGETTLETDVRRKFWSHWPGFLRPETEKNALHVPKRRSPVDEVETITERRDRPARTWKGASYDYSHAGVRRGRGTVRPPRTCASCLCPRGRGAAQARSSAPLP